jgi:hypothetical protein
VLVLKNGGKYKENMMGTYSRVKGDTSNVAYSYPSSSMDEETFFLCVSGEEIKENPKKYRYNLVKNGSTADKMVCDNIPSNHPPVLIVKGKNGKPTRFYEGSVSDFLRKRATVGEGLEPDQEIVPLVGILAKEKGKVVAPTLRTPANGTESKRTNYNDIVNQPPAKARGIMRRVLKRRRDLKDGEFLVTPFYFDSSLFKKKSGRECGHEVALIITKDGIQVFDTGYKKEEYEKREEISEIGSRKIVYGKKIDFLLKQLGLGHNYFDKIKVINGACIQGRKGCGFNTINFIKLASECENINELNGRLQSGEMQFRVMSETSDMMKSRVGCENPLVREIKERDIIEEDEIRINFDERSAFAIPNKKKNAYVNTHGLVSCIGNYNERERVISGIREIPRRKKAVAKEPTTKTDRQEATKKYKNKLKEIILRRKLNKLKEQQENLNLSAEKLLKEINTLPKSQPNIFTRSEPVIVKPKFSKPLKSTKSPIIHTQPVIKKKTTTNREILNRETKLKKLKEQVKQIKIAKKTIEVTIIKGRLSKNSDIRKDFDNIKQELETLQSNLQENIKSIKSAIKDVSVVVPNSLSGNSCQFSKRTILPPIPPLF